MDFIPLDKGHTSRMFEIGLPHLYMRYLRLFQDLAGYKGFKATRTVALLAAVRCVAWNRGGEALELLAIGWL